MKVPAARVRRSDGRVSKSSKRFGEKNDEYGESAFDILYLVFAVVTGILILKKRRDTVGKLMGISVLILGCGDAFHLVPRVLSYFVTGDFNA